MKIRNRIASFVLLTVLLVSPATWAGTPFSADDRSIPASNTAAVVTYAAVPQGRHNVSGLVWSYSGDPTSGNLKVEDGAGNIVFSMDITSKGAGFVPFSVPKTGSTNTALIITLSAGGSGITGKVNVLSHWTE